MRLDNKDRKIIAQLQANSQATVQELAEQVGLSASASWRRVKALEDAGVITGYTVRLDRHLAGFGLCALVHVSLERHEAHFLDAFVKRVLERPEVLECYATTGESDYHLRVVTRDIDAYNDFLDAFMFKLPGVSHIRTNIVLKEIKAESELPILNN